MITLRIVSIVLQINFLLVITFVCRHAILAPDWAGIGYLPIYFLIANFGNLPGVVGSIISAFRSKLYWAWWSLTSLVQLVGLGLWLWPCYEPSILKDQPGPVPFPSIFPWVVLIYVVLSWLSFFALAFIDIIIRSILHYTSRGARS